MLWKHFHCYLLSVIATIYCCVLYVPVSSPFTSALVMKIYLSPTFPSLPIAGGGVRSTLPTVSPNSCLLSPTSRSPDIFSIVPCVSSRYIPLATSFDGYALNIIRVSPGSTVSPDVVVVAKRGNWAPVTIQGVRLRFVLCIAASLMRVHSHISSAAPHSVSLWTVVSFSPHNVHFSVSASRILCSLVLVGSKSWSIAYHADMAPSDIGMVCRLFQTFLQSISCWICVTRTSRGAVAVVAMLPKVPYTRRLKCRNVSFCLLRSRYTHSRA